MTVHNLNGTSDNTCLCDGKWLGHWKHFSGQGLPMSCRVMTCFKAPEVGAHVQKDTDKGGHWYIIPLCGECNDKKGGMTLEILSSTTLVSANVAETCGK